jgi:hypothetical protein
MYTQRKKSNGVKSGERGGQVIGPPRSIHLLPKVSSKYSRTTLVQCTGAPSCWTHNLAPSLRRLDSTGFLSLGVHKTWCTRFQWRHNMTNKNVYDSWNCFNAETHVNRPEGPRLNHFYHLHCWPKRSPIMATKYQVPEHSDATMTAEVSWEDITVVTGLFQYCHVFGGLCVTYKTRFGLDDWMYCILHIHNSELQAIQRYCWSTHITVHRYMHTKILSLH